VLLLLASGVLAKLLSIIYVLDYFRMVSSGTTTDYRHLTAGRMVVVAKNVVQEQFQGHRAVSAERNGESEFTP
jgi:hypothetical protein